MGKIAALLKGHRNDTVNLLNDAFLKVSSMQALVPGATESTAMVSKSVMESKSLRGILNSVINAPSVAQQTQAMSTWKRVMRLWAPW